MIRVFKTSNMRAKNKNQLFLVLIWMFLGFMSQSPLKAQSANPLISLDGQMFTEFYNTNFRLPQFGITNQYFRFGGQTTLNCLGLPFQIDFFATTEPQTFYKTNYFKFKFDKQTFVQKITNQFNINNLEVKNKVDKILFDKNKMKLSLNLDSIRGLSLSNEFKLNQYQLNNDQKKLDSLKLLGEIYNQSEIDLLIKKLKTLRQDSISFAIKQMEYENKKRRLNKEIAKYDSLYKIDTALINHYAKFPVSNFPLDMNFHKQKNFNFPPFLEHIQAFDIGQINPIFNAFSFNGNSLRGLDLGLNIRKSNLELVLGKIQSLNTKSFSRFNTDFNMWAMGIKTDFLWKSMETTIFSHIINPNSNNYNVILGINSKFETKSNFEISGSIAQCLENLIAIPINSSENSFKSWITNKAVDLKLSKLLFSTLTVEFSNKSVGLNFRNFGNPFLSKGIFQNQIKLKTNAINNQLNVAVFYKQVEYFQINESAYPMMAKGLGFSIRTMIKRKYSPNFLFSFTPFEQGNNHPDSLFRVYTKTSILTGSIFQNVKLGKLWNLSYQGMYMKNQVEINNNQKFNSQNINFNIQFQSKSGLLINISAIQSFTTPRIDSMQSITYMGSVFAGKDNFKYGVNLLSTQYLNGGVRLSVSNTYQMDINLKQMIQLNCSYEYINHIWGLNSKHIYSINIKYLYKFDISKSAVNH